PYDDPEIGGALEVKDPRLLQEDQVATLRAVLGRHAAALDQARKLRDLDRGRYTVTWAADGISTDFKHWDATSRVRLLLEADATLRSHEGDPAGASDSIQAGLNLARSLGDEPGQTAFIARIGSRWPVVHGLQRMLSQGQAPDAVLARMQRLLT